MNTWKISIDTGGTFTDCLAVNPEGLKRRVKVLSSGRLRGKILEVIDESHIKVEENWNLNQDILYGYTFELLGENGKQLKVISYDPLTSTIRISGDLSDLTAGQDFEIYANEEAPILAARIATETDINTILPSLEMRLGSTKGTNALLERKGIKPVLIITKGFGDLPIIGTQQREHLFCLNINKPEPLFKQVIEVNERVDPNGSIKEPLSESEINKVLRNVYKSDPKVIVIALLNSYKNPLHEKTLSNLLRAKGYKHVCASYQLGQMISFLPRIQTTLVNGYLMPVFSAFFNNIINKLNKKSFLKLMTSSGGLVEAKLFHPKDSLLSGPAGGVIGTASFARKFGVDKLLSFDMGGTSTDVSRYTNTFDYIYQTRIGEHTVNSPALFIETVAAGGGSICSYDGFKFTVGPESAGASPGPACYGAGGPLTITDVNYLLGRIYPGNFGIPVNSGFAIDRLAEMKSSQPSLRELADAEILQGFFDIANEKMAKAIEKISVAKGYDPSEYTLLAFGGAGGLHACKIAETLDIGRIIIPYDAGILSAVGISHAKIERIIHRQVLRSFKAAYTELDKLLVEMRDEAVRLLSSDGLKVNEIHTQQTYLYLRFNGQDDTIEIPYEKFTDIEKRFRKKYIEVFGHCIKIAAG